MGIFAESGVGKLVLLSMMARNVAADVPVIGWSVSGGARACRSPCRTIWARPALKRSVWPTPTSQPDAPTGRLSHACRRRAFSRSWQGCSGADGLGHAPCRRAARDRAGPDQPGTGAGKITGLFIVLVEGDEAIALRRPLEDFLGQRQDESTGLGQGYQRLEQILAVAETEK